MEKIGNAIIMQKTNLMRLLILIILIGFGIHNFIARINCMSFNTHDVSQYITMTHHLFMGDIPYRDFYLFWGPLILLAPILSFKLFGANYLGYSFAFEFFNNALSITILVIIFSYYFRSKKFLLLLIITCMFNYFFVGHTTMMRTSLPLLSFYFFIRGIDEKKKIYLYLSGVFIPISFLYSYEMGIIAFITLISMIVFYLFCNFKTYYQYAGRILIGAFSVISVTVVIMLYFGILENYIDYISTLGLSKPAGAMRFVFIPRLDISFNSLKALFQSLYNILFTQADQFKVYLLIFSFIFAGLTLLSLQKETKLRSIIAIHIIFGVLLFRKIQLQWVCIHSFWAISGPLLFWLCLEYFYLKVQKAKQTTWSKQVKKYTLNLFLLFCVIWLYQTRMEVSSFKENAMLTSPLEITKIFKFPLKREKVFYDRAYVKMDFDLAADTALLLDYIERNTKYGEPIINFPWGFYSLLSSRNYVMMNIYSNYNLRKEIERIEEVKPRYAILNMWDNLGIVWWGYPRGDVGYSLGWLDEKSPGICSDGRDDLLVKYLIENYSIDKVFKYAVVLKRREKKVLFIENFTPVFAQYDLSKYEHNVDTHNLEWIGGNRYKVIGEYAYLTLKLPEEYNSLLYETSVKVHYSFPRKYFANGKLEIIINPFEGSPQVISVEPINVPLDYEKDEDFLKIKRGWGPNREVKVKTIKIAFLFKALFGVKPDFVEVEYIKLLSKIPVAYDGRVREDIDRNKGVRAQNR